MLSHVLFYFFTYLKNAEPCILFYLFNVDKYNTRMPAKQNSEIYFQKSVFFWTRLLINNKLATKHFKFVKNT